MVDEGDTLSVSVTGDDVDDIEAFEDYFQSLDETYSRAGRIKEAMVFYKEIHQLVTEELEHTTSPDEIGEHQFRHLVRQAMFDRERREVEGEVPY